MENQGFHAAFLIYIVFIISTVLGAGCGEEFSQSDVISSIKQNVIIGRRSSSGLDWDGTDEQGPSIDHATSKCIYEFKLTGDAAKACIKMLTAKYYSTSDYSYTFPGTLLYAADKNTSWGSGPRFSSVWIGGPEVYMTFEAIWGINGALCIFRPRWPDIYDKFKPTSGTLRDCTVNPGPGLPWIDSPFSGDGLLISYSINKQHKLYTKKSQINGEVFTIPTKYSGAFEIISELLVYDYHPVKINNKNTSYVEYDYDSNFALLNLWERCAFPGSSLAHPCDYLATTDNLSNAGPKAARKIPLDANFNYVASGSNLGFISKNYLPGTIELNTYIDEDTGRHLTTTLEGKGKLTTRRLTKLITEGYVYPLQINTVTDGPSPVPPSPGCTPCPSGVSCPTVCVYTS